MLTIITHLVRQRAWFIVTAALLLTLGSAWYGVGVFSHLASDEGFESSNTESTAVADSLKNDFATTQPSAIVMFTSRDGSPMDTAGNRAEVLRLVKPLESEAVLLATYYTTRQPAFLSNDKTRTYAAVTLKGDEGAQYARIKEFVAASHSDRLQVDAGGAIVAQRQSTEQVRKDLEIAELITLPVLALLLVLVFRGLVAAAMPLMLGVIAIVGGLSVVRLLTLVTSIDQYAVNVITVLGLGLSVDYSLLMVSRFREELERQPDVETAVHHTVMTSGRTIFFSGLTVIISLLALSVFPIGFLRSISLGGVAALSVAIIAALTVLPACLRLLGPRVNALRLGRPASGSGSFWGRLNLVTSRYPLLTIALAVVVILAAAAPFRQVHYLAFDYRALPLHSSARNVAEALENQFGNGDSSVNVLYRPDGPAPAALAGLTGRLAGTSGASGVDPAVASKDGTVYKLAVHYHEDDSGTVGRDLVASIRSLDAPGGQLQVGGGAAEVSDTLATIGHYLPLAAAIIVIAMGVLLSLMLRSVLIPLQAIVLSGFGLLAAFGALVFIFQQGHFTGGSWLAETGGLSPTILLLIFTIAFGLSMDYATFLYSRMREEYDKIGRTREAVHNGVERTGYTITAAAVLLFVVVAAFASSKIPMLQQVGLGLALAVIVDAFVVRILLVPSAMLLLGRANWYAPKWLARWQIRHD